VQVRTLLPRSNGSNHAHASDHPAQVQEPQQRPQGRARVWCARGRARWRVVSGEPFKALRQPVEHSLAVADVVVILRQLERQGLAVHAVHTEPDSHVQLGGVDLKPDLFMEFEHPQHGHFKRWVEMDMATQGRKRIMEKFRLYAQASRLASAEERQAWQPWPRTLFIAVDEERRRELLYLLRDVPEDYRTMFAVSTREDLPRMLS
jgi:hypothetical protein